MRASDARPPTMVCLRLDGGCRCPSEAYVRAINTLRTTSESQSGRAMAFTKGTDLQPNRRAGQAVQVWVTSDRLGSPSKSTADTPRGHGDGRTDRYDPS